jgi:hypothetical protein
LKGKRAPVAGSTNKKIVVHRFDRESLPGFVNPQTYLQAAGVEILTASGNLLVVPYGDVKALYFVRDFDSNEPPGESRLFQNRPKANGVWIRMKFRDGDVMDGLMPNNLLQLEPYGFTFIPPGAGSNNQKVFVPRTALTELQVLGVVGSPLRVHKPRPKPQEQIELFE